MRCGTEVPPHRNECRNARQPGGGLLKNDMILVKTVGDLGNLMFQYSFGYIVARRLKTSFCLNNLRELAFFELDGDTPAANLLRKARFKAGCLWRRPAVKNWMAFNDAAYAAPKTVLSDLSDHAIYRGYFQSSDYHEGYAEEVKKLFKVKANFRQKFEQRCKSFLEGPPLGVLHLRGKWHGDWERISLPWSYYENCLQRVKDRENYRWLVITDDVPNAQQRLPAKHPMEIVSGEVIDDFQLMSHARIHIMANSTFSWWAAYLNPSPAARIMAPNYWYGHRPEYQWEAPAGIMYPGWEWVPTGKDNGEN